MGENKHSKVMSLKYFGWISMVREKHGETQIFQIYGFLKYFG